jgi:DNA-binding transcriptional regulator YhcF (GntR family)
MLDPNYCRAVTTVSGRMRAGDALPFVRELSTVLNINPNTAHKVVTQMVAEGLLEVRTPQSYSIRNWSSWWVEAKKLGLELDG